MWNQVYDPFNSAALSTLAAALPATGPAWAQTTPAANVVDVHHHYTSPALLAMMKGRRTRQGGPEEPETAAPPTVPAAPIAPQDPPKPSPPRQRARSRR